MIVWRHVKRHSIVHKESEYDSPPPYSQSSKIEIIELEKKQ